jgi:hypothetical protein
METTEDKGRWVRALYFIIFICYTIEYLWIKTIAMNGNDRGGREGPEDAPWYVFYSSIYFPFPPFIYRFRHHREGGAKHRARE